MSVVKSDLQYWLADADGMLENLDDVGVPVAARLIVKYAIAPYHQVICIALVNAAAMVI